VSLGLVGRAFSFVGIICGLLAVGLPALTLSIGGVGFSVRYVDDGTAAAFLFVLLALASHFPAEIGRDVEAAALGTAAFGFLLFVPATFAFDDLGYLDSGAWLGLCTALIPIGLLVVQRDHGHSPSEDGRSTLGPRGRLVLALGGLILIVVGIWLPVDDEGPSFWSSSHTLGILMLLLAVLNLLLLARSASDDALLLAAATFGLVVYPFVIHAFEKFGSLGSGGWIEAIGGVALLAGVASLRMAARSEGAPGAATAPA
jgi:hypothetical protein